MSLHPTQHREMLALEGFIRRAATLPDLPFMLKGSYVTRQYFARPTDRRPGDLDWVCMVPIGSVEQARALFDDWATRITECQLDHGVTFTSFRENAFWRLIDYAMDDDFPTVNTDLEYQVDGGETEGFLLDISYNLPMAVPSVPLHYQPLRGAAFTVPHTAPLSLQVAWKLHQTLVRPRFKDLYDLLHLLRHWGFTAQVREQALAALAQECRADGTDPARLNYLLPGNLASLFVQEVTAAQQARWQHGQPHPELRNLWHEWRYGQIPPTDHYAAQQGLRYYHSHAGYILPDPAALPATLPEFEQQLRAAFAAAGFAVPAGLPAPERPSAELPAAIPPAAEPPTASRRGLLDSLRGLFGGR